MLDSWKKLSTKQLLAHPRLKVYEDEVVLPNGYQTQYLHFGKSQDAAMVIAVNDEGRIFVQKEYSYPPDEWLYQFPGGALEDDETPEQGAVREFAEEGGMAGDLQSIGSFYVDNRRRPNKSYVFVAHNLKETQATKDAEEVFEDFWFTESEIDTMIGAGEITNYTLLAGWALYKNR